MKDIVYEEWVPAGTLMKALVEFSSLLILCKKDFCKTMLKKGVFYRMRYTIALGRLGYLTSCLVNTMYEAMKAKVVTMVRTSMLGPAYMRLLVTEAAS